MFRQQLFIANDEVSIRVRSRERTIMFPRILTPPSNVSIRVRSRERTMGSKPQCISRRLSFNPRPLSRANDMLHPRTSPLTKRFNPRPLSRANDYASADV